MRMSIVEQQKRLVAEVASAISPPPVVSVLLPPLPAPAGRRDEFGFLLLEDGSVGPFYLCLGDTAALLQGRLSQTSPRGQDPTRLALRLGSPDLADSALALGACNAIGQHLMRRAGFDPAAGGKGAAPAMTARHIGMVGYFPPLAERLLAQGRELTVIEQQPERVPPHPGIRLFTTPEALAACDHVLCTASTLINDTLDGILASCGPGSRVELIGPSASGLPDPLFAGGVTGAGGIVIDDPSLLRSALAAGEKWSRAGRKYHLAADAWPGVQALLSRA